MKVTSLKYTKKGNRVNVYIDGKFKLSLERSLITDLKIYKGVEINEELIEDWRVKDQHERFISKVLHLIAKRPRSEKEILDYLNKKLFKIESRREIINLLIKKLKKDGHVDDYEFALWWIKNRMQFKPRGRYMLIRELRRKGIKYGIINEAIGEAGLDKEREIKYALELGEKKKRISKDISGKKGRNRFLSYLVRKGFSYSIAKKVYEMLNND